MNRIDAMLDKIEKKRITLNRMMESTDVFVKARPSSWRQINRKEGRMRSLNKQIAVLRLQVADAIWDAAAQPIEGK